MSLHYLCASATFIIIFSGRTKQIKKTMLQKTIIPTALFKVVLLWAFGGVKLILTGAKHGDSSVRKGVHNQTFRNLSKLELQTPKRLQSPTVVPRHHPMGATGR